jgi:glycerophosphoryl diester phosphodiesterase
MRFLYSLIILSILFSCRKKSNNSVFIFGHAGMGLDMPNSLYHDNSLEAIELCLSIPNSNGVEVDVQIDKQGCLWLYHDEYLDKITNLSGCVNDKTTKELEGAHYRTFKKEKLLKLNEILHLIGSDQKLFLDIKNRNAFSNSIVNDSLLNESLISVLTNNNSKVMVILSDLEWLTDFSTSYPTYFSTDNFSLGYSLLSSNSNLRGLVIRNKYIEKQQVSELKSLNKEVYLFDMRSPKGNRKAISKNPTGIITDDIRAALIER